jgi:glucose/arabinose dehydrogenase
MKISNQSFSKLVTCAILALGLASCSGGGSGGGSTTAPPPATGSVTVTGTVLGTVIKVLSADTKALISQTDTAPLPGPPPFPFTLSNIPVGLPIEIFFFSAGQTFPLYVGIPPTNVFTVQTAGSIDLGFVTMDGGRATPENQPSNVTLGAEDLSPTLIIISPSQGDSLPSGPVDVSFGVQSFTIGSLSASHLHIYLDGGPRNHFYNGTNNVVLDDNDLPVANITWQSTSSFQITGLSSGSHAIRLALANSAHEDLQNAGANPPILNISIQAPPAPPTLTINSPAQGATLPAGPVPVTFTIQNSPVTTSTQPRMQFYVDNITSVLYKFYDGSGITEDGSTSGVRYQGVHTHFVHWKSGSSVQFNALASGPHQVNFALLDLNEAPLPGTEKTLDFSIAAGTGGAFSLLQVASGLSFPTAMATAPDGRIFVTELMTGKIRVVTPTATPPWLVQSAPFATLPVVTGNEKGLLGIAVDPNFSQNRFVYAFYTAAGPVNRVVRFTATTSNGDTIAAAGSQVTIFDNIPAADDHNGGTIQFGPDGMLYIFVGDNNILPAEAQNLGTLKGKILRINPTTPATIPSDNPFVGTLSAPFSAIYSLGHRNSFGFTFHRHTNDLWQTENGDRDNDQINRIIAGGNYGWPDCAGICNNPLYIDPIFTFGATRIAPTGIVAIREDSIYPAQYHNNLLFANFNFGQLHRIALGGVGLTDFSTHSVVCNCGQGGLLAVMHGLHVPGQDGYIYVSNGGGSIFRVVSP